MLVLSGGWLPRTISGGLADWAAVHAGRRDLRFCWDPRSDPPWSAFGGSRLPKRASRLGSVEELGAWAVRHQVRIRRSRGVEPVLACAPVLAYATNA
jgi:hypothetical protein